MRRARLAVLPAVIAAATIAAVAAGCTSSSGGAELATRDALLDPKTCTQCHADHYREWSGSMHAYASDDPVFRAMNKRGQRETGGALGTFCVKCHAPMAVRDGKTKDGLDLDALDPKYKGVTCFFCHSVDGVDGAHDAALHLSDDLALRGEYKDPVANTAHRATYSALHDRDQGDSAKMCGACHDITTDHGADIERTFAEWQASVFSHLGGGTTCSQCHMSQSTAPRPIAEAPNVFSRNFHSHTFAAIDTALAPFPEADAQKQAVLDLLGTTLLGAVCVETFSADASVVKVILDNAGSGHAFPSGSAQDRRVWAEVIAYRAGAPLYQSGAVADGASVTAATNDPDLWLLRDCLFDDQSKEVRMFWQASSYEGNALPAQATFDPSDDAFYRSHVLQTYPRDTTKVIPGAPDRVTVRVRVLPMGYDVIDDLIASGDLDPSVRGALTVRDALTLEWTPGAVTETFNDNGAAARCVSSTPQFAAAAKTVPAIHHTKCGP